MPAAPAAITPSPTASDAASCAVGFPSSSTLGLTPNGKSPGSSASRANLPFGASEVSAQIRAICARRYSFSLPGNGGYARTSAERSPVTNLRIAIAAEICAGVTCGSSTHGSETSVVTKYVNVLHPVPRSSSGTGGGGAPSSGSSAAGSSTYLPSAT